MNYPAASYGVSVIPDRLKLSENVWNKKNGISSAGRTGGNKRDGAASLAFADSLHLDMLKLTVGIRIYPGDSTGKNRTGRRHDRRRG